MKKKLTGKFDSDQLKNKKDKKGGKKNTILDATNLPIIIENEEALKKEN